jgi:hypothetical protein
MVPTVRFSKTSSFLTAFCGNFCVSNFIRLMAAQQRKNFYVKKILLLTLRKSDPRSQHVLLPLRKEHIKWGAGNKFHLVTCHEGTKGQLRHSSTLSFTSGVGGGGWLMSRPGRFTPGKETRYPLCKRLGGPQGL